MFHSPLIRFFSTFSLFFSRHIDKSGNTMYTIISDEVEIWRRQVLYFTKQGLAIRCVLHLIFYFSATFSILSPLEIAYLTVYAEPPVSFVR